MTATTSRNLDDIPPDEVLHIEAAELRAALDARGRAVAPKAQGLTDLVGLIQTTHDTITAALPTLDPEDAELLRHLTGRLDHVLYRHGHPDDEA